VSKTSQLKFIIAPIFTKFSLKTKKKDEFPLWKKAVDIAYISTTEKKNVTFNKGQKTLNNWQWEEFKSYCDQIKKIRTYDKESNNG